MRGAKTLTRVKPVVFSKEEQFEEMLKNQEFVITGYRETRDYIDYYIAKDGLKMKYRFYLYIGALPAETYYKQFLRKYKFRRKIHDFLH